MYKVTHEARGLDSSFVDSVWFNSDSNSAIVALVDDHDPDSRRCYVYEGVTLSDFDDLVNSSSVGTHYNTQFKPKFGPATRVFTDSHEYDEIEPRPAYRFNDNTSAQRVEVDITPSELVSVPQTDEQPEELRTFSLTYSWQGKEFPAFEVETASVLHAVEKLAGILRELGLDGAVIQVPVDELV